MRQNDKKNWLDKAKDRWKTSRNDDKLKEKRRKEDDLVEDDIVSSQNKDVKNAIAKLSCNFNSNLFESNLTTIEVRFNLELKMIFVICKILKHTRILCYSYWNES